MAQFLVLMTLTEQGLKNIKKSTARAASFRKTAATAGVDTVAQYWTIGSRDGAVILRADNENDVLRAVARLAADGYVRTETMRALDANEFDGVVAD